MGEKAEEIEQNTDERGKDDFKEKQIDETKSILDKDIKQMKDILDKIESKNIGADKDIKNIKDDQPIDDTKFIRDSEIVSPTADDRAALKQRQLEVIDYVRQNGKITRLEYVVNFKVPLPVADKELEELVKMNIFSSSGEGPHKVYKMIDKKEK